MLNILTTLTDYLLKNEEGEEESYAIPDGSISDWYKQVSEQLSVLKKDPKKHKIRIAQLEKISQHLDRVLQIRKNKCHSQDESK